MNDHTHNPDTGHSQAAHASDSSPTGVEHTLEVLASRIVDQCADEQDWATFATLAQSSPRGPATAWRMLAELQREHAEFTLAVHERIDAAARVALPMARAGAATSSRTNNDGRTFNQHRTRVEEASGMRLARWSRWGGWAVAACVGLAWIGAGRFTITTPPGQSPDSGELALTNQASLGGAAINAANWTINTPDDALRAYLDVGGKSGRVLGELPQRVIVRALPVGNHAPVLGTGTSDPNFNASSNVLIGSGPSAGVNTNGGNASTAVQAQAILTDGQPIEVIYLRQIVERAVISDVVNFSRDERGRLVPVRMPIQTIEPWSE